MMDTYNYTFVQNHSAYNIKSYPSYKLGTWNDLRSVFEFHAKVTLHWGMSIMGEAVHEWRNVYIGKFSTFQFYCEPKVALRNSF